MRENIIQTPPGSEKVEKWLFVKKLLHQEPGLDPNENWTLLVAVLGTSVTIMV